MGGRGERVVIGEPLTDFAITVEHHHQLLESVRVADAATVLLWKISKCEKLILLQLGMISRTYKVCE